MASLNSRSEDGFTLMEMLFVLFIMALILMVAIPVVHHTIVEHKTKQFFTILDSDILRMQNQAIANNEKMNIYFDKDHYVVMRGRKLIYTRDYPDHIEFAKPDIITYTALGTVSNPRTLIFYSQENFMYRMVFPLGKGRHYVEKDQRVLSQ